MFNPLLIAENYLKIDNSIGEKFISQGNYDKAVKYYEKELNAKNFIFGENNLNVATAYNNIGYAYKLKGNYNKAIFYYEKALKIRSSTLG